MDTLFFRLLSHVEKAAALTEAVRSVRAGTPTREIFTVDPSSFEQVPGSPFAYWVSEQVRKVFKALPPFHDNERRLRLGDHPSDDFRYLRLWWEVSLVQNNREWVIYYKGGSNIPYYGESSLVVDWDSKRQTYRGFFGRPGRSSVRPSNYQFFFLPGLTVPYLPHKRGLFSHVPPGGVFGHASPVVQLPRNDHWATLSLLNSDAYIGLLHLLMPRGVNSGQTLKYEVGYLASVPLPEVHGDDKDLLEKAARQGFSLVRSLFSADESSKFFVAPVALSSAFDSLSQAVASWRRTLENAQQTLAANQASVNDAAFRLYRIDCADRRIIEEGLVGLHISAVALSGSDNGEEASQRRESGKEVAAGLLSYAVGCGFGRWDSRIGTGTLAVPQYPDPFSPLSIFPLGSLRTPEVHAKGEFGECPLRVDRNAILLDDPDHSDDMVRRVRVVLEKVWKDRAEAIEKEACKFLGVKELRDYFRKPGTGGFWDDHVSRYSKSRRKAPIYWLLQSAKKNYALWLYYHRLDKDILFKALQPGGPVQTKINLEQSRLDSLRPQKSALGTTGKGVKKLDRDIERQEAFLGELKDFEEKLRRAANLDFGKNLDSAVVYDPDLNDGVVLNIAPLWELVPWKEAKSYWDELLAGKYEWSSMGKLLRKKGLVT